jgi:hypothetical protein
VVSSIVMIVLVDGIFAYISYRTGFWWMQSITRSMYKTWP